MKLHGTSFHSVKGGVGRTRLSSEAASQAAWDNPTQPVYLIDTDFLGTSRADGMDVCAPRWSNLPEVRDQTLVSPPDGFFTATETRDLIEKRFRDGCPPLHVPFLNDFIMFATLDWDEETDVHIDSICWRFEHGPENLRLIPSSTLPYDVNRMMPLLNDEDHAAFIEGRLEYLLAAILKRHPEQEPHVIFDCSRGIHGVSKSVLSMGLRLSHSPKQSLAEDGGMPLAVSDAEIAWTPFFVMGPDLQDKVATARWLSLAQGTERNRIKTVQG